MGQAWVTLSGLFHWVATTGPGGFMTLNDSLRSMIFDHVASHMTSVQKVQPNDKRTSHVMFCPSHQRLDNYDIAARFLIKGDASILVSCQLSSISNQNRFGLP